MNQLPAERATPAALVLASVLFGGPFALAADTLNVLTSEVENTPHPMLNADSDAPWAAVDERFADTDITKDDLPVTRNKGANGNLVIVRNMEERTISVNLATMPLDIKQLIDPGGTVVWTCQSSDQLPTLSLEGLPPDHRKRALSVDCGDTLVVGAGPGRLAKYEEQGPSKPSDYRRAAQGTLGAEAPQPGVDPTTIPFAGQVEREEPRRLK